MQLCRRTVLGLLAATPSLLAARTSSASMSGRGAVSDPGRNRVAVGTCLEMHHIGRDPRLRAIASRRYSRITPEYSLQWSSFEPEEGRHHFGAVDRLLAFALANRQTVHGHALLWEQGTPGWGTPEWVKARLADRPDWGLIRRRFETVLVRYGAEIPTWTVVNEPIETGLRSDGLRNNVFLRAFGPGYIYAAFETAEELAPRARLMINEYGLEHENPVDHARRRAALSLVEDLKRRGHRVDVFGLQGHLDLGKGAPDPRGLGGFLRDLASLGVEIHVSELDVLERDRSLSIDERDRRVADATARFLDIVLDQPAVSSVTTWGISDRFSWLRGDFSVIDADLHDRAREYVNRGLPYDVSCRPKPMEAVMSGAFAADIALLQPE